MQSALALASLREYHLHRANGWFDFSIFFEHYLSGFVRFDDRKRWRAACKWRLEFGKTPNVTG